MEFPYICGMKISSYLRNRALKHAFEQFLAEKTMAKLPNFQRINTVLVILDENDKSIHKSIESSVKALFGATRCGFIILCNQMSDTILQSDLYNEITPKDFGFMSVLKPDKIEYLKKLPYSAMIVNMAGKSAEISDYLCTLPKSDFRISFQQSKNVAIYDLVIENPRNTDPVSNIHVLHNYLKALAGTQL
ncbi:MAG: hypothetical protein IKO23_02720 [Bacteroidales bacterium]|nr:hypothetical protein [Bacteroidales bacterium]